MAKFVFNRKMFRNIRILPGLTCCKNISECLGKHKKISIWDQKKNSILKKKQTNKQTNKQTKSVGWSCSPPYPFVKDYPTPGNSFRYNERKGWENNVPKSF